MSAKVLFLAGGLACSIVCLGQVPWGPRTFPQFRDMAGMSGNGFPVNRDGSIGMSGAMSLSTPIAYLVGPKQFVLGVCSRSFDRRFRGLNSDPSGQERSDGTAQFIGGFEVGNGRLAVSALMVSAARDFVTTVQYQLPPDPDKQGDWTFAAGIHNFSNRPSANGDNDPVADAELSRSVFIVATKDCSREQYFTIGIGDTRYRGPFGSYSLPLNDNWRAFGEFDTFNWNFGAATEFSVLGKRAYLQLGLVRGTLATWSFNWVF